MQMIDDAGLLDVWERMRPLPRPWREVALLSTVTTGSADDISALPIGERDRRLLELRERTLGRRLECRASCPGCDTPLEWTHDAAAPPPPVRAVDATLTLEDGATAICRAPDSRDLAACARADDPERTLFDRCVVVTDCVGATQDPAALSPAARQAVQQQLARLDPDAEMRMALVCPDCGHAWTVVFDPAAFVLEEIDVYAQRLMEEVHTLASAYGWTESEILSMPRGRRQRYLELALG